MEPQTFKDAIIQNMESVEQCIVERESHEQELQNGLKRLNERKLQIQKCKVQKVKASNASSGDKYCSRIVSDKENDQVLENQSNTSGDESSRSRNECTDKSTSRDDTDIRPSYDTKPMVEVPYTAEYNVFVVDTQHSEQSECIINTCVVEKVDSNAIHDSPDMCDNDIQTDQNVKDKQTSRTLGESNSIWDSCLVALQSKQSEFERYKAFNDHTVDYDKLKRKLNETLRLLAQKEIDIKEDLKLEDYEISVVKEKHDELVKLSLLTNSHYEGLVKENTKTQNDSFAFVHELKQEMHADLMYVESLEKEIDELESDKAEFSNMYDILLQEFCKEKASNVFQKEREQYFKIQDLKAQLQDKNIAISELKKLIEKMKGKSVDTNFKKQSILRKPPLQPIRSQPVVRQPTKYKSKRSQLPRHRIASHVGVSHDLTKPIALHSWPQVRKSSFAKPYNVNALGPSRNSLKHVSFQSPREYKDKALNTKPSVQQSARLPNTANGLNSRASTQKKDTQSYKKTKRYMPIEKKCDSKKHDRQIPMGQKISLNKSSNVYLKTTPPRSGLTWKPTGRIFTQMEILLEPTTNKLSVGDLRDSSLIPAKSNSLPRAHAQTTKTYYKHQDQRIKIAQVLKTKTSANSDIKDPFLETKLQGRFLASFQDDAKMDGNNQIIPIATDVAQSGFSKWSRALCPTTRHNYMTSNSVESVNTLTKDVQKLPITTLMEWFRDLLQKWYYEHQAKHQDAQDNELTEWGTVKVKRRMLKSANWMVKGFMKEKFKRYESTKIHVVYLEKEETFTDPDLTKYTIKVPPPSVQIYKPPSQREFVVHQKDPLYPNIPYPSRMLKQKQQEKDEVQIHKFWQMFKQLHISITLADALILMPNELRCKALADLDASINLMPLSIWKKLGLLELIPTCLTLELVNRVISTPVGIARDVFVPVGKFTFPTDFVIVDYESDPRVPLILGRPFLRIAHALIDVHGEEMILDDGVDRLTLNMRHDTSSYSNQPQKESINFINVFNNSSEDFLEDLFSSQPSGNPTFSPHPELTSPEVNNDIFDSEGHNVLSDKLLDLDSTKDLHPPLHDNPLSRSTTYLSNPLLEEFVDELPSEYDDNLQFDIESDLKEMEFLLYQDKDFILKDLIDQKDLANLADIFVDFVPVMFIDEHALDYSSPSIFDEYDDDFLDVESYAGNVYDDPFDSKGEKIKESKLLIDELDLPCDLHPPLSILIQEKPVEIITRVVQDKKLAISNASLVLEDFDPPFYEPIFFKEVPKSKMLLPFSFENEEKISNQGYTLLKKFIRILS
uniref:Reverse transcriptase domain-containing protein n=1 Tax=Tanacetum cinerariifolium TaxID=118510 RepID=A0A699GRU1_TANCI|nr:hypothetical protein [Tanacetum cinerariifolium]